VIVFASARTEIADFLSALLTVYVIVIIAWIVIQFVFAMGVRVPYSRWSNAILDFLRDTANPWLSIFRRLPLQIGPLDLSPIVAIIALHYAADRFGLPPSVALLAGGAAFVGELTGGASLGLKDIVVLALLPFALTGLATWVARAAVLKALREAL